MQARHTSDSALNVSIRSMCMSGVACGLPLVALTQHVLAHASFPNPHNKCNLSNVLMDMSDILHGKVTALHR